MNQEWQEITLGNKDSFVQLYDAYYKPLFHYGLKIRQDRELIKECLHILFCELWEKHSSLPPNIQNPKFYLFTWFKRIILKNLPQQELGVEVLTEEPIQDSVETQQIEIEQLLETHRKLELALANLTKKQRRFIQLRFFENKSYEEISQLENASVRTVYNVIYEALKNLKGNFIYQSLFIFIFSK
ncbi:RNA polymerase sigma factor [Sphingobacterium suaedae]|uniref:RNA polymerase sigma factor n=1 Tax=Sphingobacterium suaedae TaxID=1686402 RepID=A0ABW5KMU1_9SPHI